MISEKIALLGQDVYEGKIPNQLTLKSIPTGSELDYVGAEDFDDIMLNKILPQCIEESIDPKQLLEIDYHWILRCLRFINYGPYIHVGAIFCGACETTSRGEYLVNLETVECKPLPAGFQNKLTISKEEFLDFKQDIVISLPTIQDIQNSLKDKQFKDAFGKTNRNFARICYTIKSIGGQRMDPVSIRMKLQKDLSSADYVILREKIAELTDYGLRSGGKAVCPKCKDQNAAFVALTDERFFRPSVDALRRWREDRDRRQVEDVPRDENSKVREHNR